MSKLKDKLRDEFKQKCDLYDKDGGFIVWIEDEENLDFNIDLMADYWLSRIETLLKERDEALVEKIEKYGVEMQGGYPFPTVQQDVVKDIINLIKK